MGVLTVLTRLLPGDGTVVVVQCRRYGENLLSGADECPKCGADEIERPQISE